jgi:hypothetical protein
MNIGILASHNGTTAAAVIEVSLAAWPTAWPR